MTSLFEQLGGTYHQNGDYLIPDLALPQSSSSHLGKYGRMRRTFLKEQHSATYTAMFMDGSLWPYLSEIDQTAHGRMERICSAMATSEGVTEALKASNQMEWVRQMNVSAQQGSVGQTKQARSLVCLLSKRDQKL